MKYTLILLQLMTNIPSVQAAQPFQAFNSRVFAQTFLSSVNDLLQTNIHLDVMHKEKMSGAEPHGGDGSVHFADIDLDNYDQKPFAEKTEEAFAFVLAHEISHNLIDYNPSIARAPYTKEFADYISLNLKLDDRYRGLAGDLGHENVDAFAAKLLKQLGYGIEGGVISLENVGDRYEPADATKLKPLLHERARLITLEYQEGWNSWVRYNQMISPCAVYADNVFSFLRKIQAQKILETIGPSACTYFSGETFIATVKNAIPRFKAIYQ